MILEITERSELDAFLTEAKRLDLLKGVDLSNLSEDKFPIRIPVKMDAVFKVASNPIVRKAFGKKIESVVLSYMETVVQ